MSNQSQFIEHIAHPAGFTPFSAQWVPCSAKLAVAGCHARGTGVLEILEITANRLNVLTQSSHSEGFKCSTFGASSFETRSLATGDYEGALHVWDIERMSRPSMTLKAHSAIINAIDGCGGLNIGGGAPELVTGSHDGSVKVWDLRQSAPVCALEPESGSTGRDCWSVAFGNSYNGTERCIVAGYDNGDIKMLDLRTNTIRWSTNVSNGVVGLQFDRKDIEMNKLIVTTLESKYRVYDLRTYHPTQGFSHTSQTAHKSTVWLAKHTPQSRDQWLTAGGNGSLSVWQYEYPAQRAVKGEDGESVGVMGEVTLKGEGRWGDQPIVSAEWHPDKPGLLAAASLDQQVRVGIVTKLT